MINTNKPKNIFINIFVATLMANLFQGSISSEIARAGEKRIPGKPSHGQLHKREILISESVQGTIETSITWGNTSLPSETTSTITLDEPLLFANSPDIALPKNSSLTIQVKTWDDGFVTLSPVAIKYKNNAGELVQAEIPEGALLIRDENNQPLKFETRESNNNSFVDDLLSGTLQDVVQEGSRRLPVPGGAGYRIGRTIRSRSRRSRTRSSEGEVHFVEANTKVTVYVNSFLSL